MNILVHLIVVSLSELNCYWQLVLLVPKFLVYAALLNCVVQANCLNKLMLVQKEKCYSWLFVL
jgi:hypothetical protein